MKKIFWFVGGVLLLTTTVYAQTPKLKASDASFKRKSVATLIERSKGKVESLQKSDFSKGNFGKLSIIDETGKKKDFDLIAKTQVHSSNSAQIAFSDLKKGNEIIVLYVQTLRGTKDVITITLTK